MTASKNSSTSAQAGTSAGSTGFDQAAQPMQQMFESWLNAWRGFADPARAATAASAANPFAAFQFPTALPFQMPAMPDLAGLGNFASPFAGLKLPVAAIPPERLQKLQADYARDCITLMQQASAAKLESPELKDRRFSGDAWKASPAHAFAAAWYLLNARYLQELADALETDPKTRERIRFAVQQWTAAAPSNFLALNPDAQKSILDTRAKVCVRG
jgi:polyhydroxyalkanoate synthase